jgi:hypothetical protein
MFRTFLFPFWGWDQGVGLNDNLHAPTQGGFSFFSIRLFQQSLGIVHQFMAGKI